MLIFIFCAFSLQVMKATKQLQRTNPSYKQILTKDSFHSYETSKEEPEPSMNHDINTSLEMPKLATQPSTENNFPLLKKMSLRTVQSLNSFIQYEQCSETISLYQLEN